MNSNYTFTNEKFSITEDIFFTVDVTVIKGNKICKLKTLKIFYRGETFEMDCKSTINKYIITDGLRSIFSIELINYLNRFINHTNLYEIYSIDLNSEILDQDLTVRCAPDRDIQQDLSSLIIHDERNENSIK